VRRDDRAIADLRPVEHDDARPQPYVVADLDAFARRSLVPDRPVEVAMAVVGAQDGHVGADQAVVADLDPDAGRCDAGAVRDRDVPPDAERAGCLDAAERADPRAAP